MKKLLKSILIATAGIGMVAGTTAAVVSCGESGTTVSPEQKNYNDEIKKMSDYLVAHPVHFDINDNGLADLTKAINDYLTQAPTTDKQYLTATVTSDMIKDVGNINLSQPTAGETTITVNISASDAYKTKVVTDGEKLTLKYTVTQTDATIYASAIAKIHAYFDVATTPLFLVRGYANVDSKTFPTTLIGDFIKDKIANFINSKQTTLTQDEKKSLFLGDKWSGITVSYTGTVALDTKNSTSDPEDKYLDSDHNITIAIKGMSGSGAETTGTPIVYNAAKYIVTSPNTVPQYNAEASKLTGEFTKEVSQQQFPIVFAKGDDAGGKNAIVNAINEYINKHKLDTDLATTTRLLQNVSISDFDFSGLNFNPTTIGEQSANEASFSITIKSTDDTITPKPISFALKCWVDPADGEAQNLQTELATWSKEHPIIVSFSFWKSGQEGIVSKAIADQINMLNKTGKYHTIFKPADVTDGDITLKNYAHHYLGTETQNLFVTINPTALQNNIRSWWNFSITISGIL